MNDNSRWNSFTHTGYKEAVVSFKYMQTIAEIIIWTTMWFSSLMMKQFFNNRFRCCYKSATSESVVWCPVPRLKQQLSVRAAVTLVPARLPLSLHKHLLYYFECSVCNQLLKWSKISAVPVPFASTAFVNFSSSHTTLLRWFGHLTEMHVPVEGLGRPRTLWTDYISQPGNAVVLPWISLRSWLGRGRSDPG